MVSNDTIITPEGHLDLAMIFDAVNHTFNPKFDVPATRSNFMKFPPEVRANIIDFNLLGDLEMGTLTKALHYDSFGSPCCVWNWPHELIVCDKATESEMPNIMFPKWLPHLALANHQMRGEVLVHMLRTTACITLKYDKDLRVKIASWLSKFLATFPENEGFTSVYNLNFPHIHWYNYNHDVPTIDTNPDVDLMLQCTELRRVGMTFHFKRIVKSESDDEEGELHPLALSTFLDHWKLRPMLGCDRLEHVYIGGIQRRDANMDEDQLQTLRDFGRWLRESFAKKTPPQKVTVRLYPRFGAFNGWHVGQLL